jgi:hypothetical protein
VQGLGAFAKMMKGMRRALLALMFLGLLAALWVGVWRSHVEAQSRRVEIALDYTEFAAFADSYGYDREKFLIALHAAGLTSLAVSEELGTNINLGNGAVFVSGQQAIDQARLAPIGEPTLARLAREEKLNPADLYLLVYAPAEIARYRQALALHFSPRSVRLLRPAGPAIFAVRSQADFFNSLGFGLPAEPLAIALRTHLLLVPRFQNDERFGAAKIGALIGALRNQGNVSTVMFFGISNEVLGFPDHLDDIADAIRASGYNFGSIETYDKSQVQKGNQGLGQRVAAQTVRVQAIAKLEQDKLDLDSIAARYLLGVRERNVRVIYLRPMLHADGDLSLEMTNVKLVRTLAQRLRADGFLLGRARPVGAPDGREFNVPFLLVALVSLAVPAICLLLLETFGVRSRRLVLAAFGLDFILLAGGYATHHDLLARKILALAGAIAFAIAAVVAVSRRFSAAPPAALGDTLKAGVQTALRAAAVALCGGLVVVGLLSVPILMSEIEGFSGVKAVILVPPLIVLGLYLFTRRFRGEPLDPLESAQAPVRVYQLALLGVLAAIAFVYISRSGNTSDIAPSAFELSVRSGLTEVLGVRPRFKEFAIGFPLLMLLPALRLDHKRAYGWFFALGIAVGTSDIIDTFSHLHTSLGVSLIRLGNGAVLGCALGALAVVLYRAYLRRAGAARA